MGEAKEFSGRQQCKLRLKLKPFSRNDLMFCEQSRKRKRKLARELSSIPIENSNLVERRSRSISRCCYPISDRVSSSRSLLPSSMLNYFQLSLLIVIVFFLTATHQNESQVNEKSYSARTTNADREFFPSSSDNHGPLKANKSIHRLKRFTFAPNSAPPKAGGGPADSTTRIVAISGQSIELQCPLASELLTIANSGAQNPDHEIIWLKDGSRLNQLSPRFKINQTNNSLIILSAQPALDDGLYECALVHTLKENHLLKAHKFELKLIVQPKLAPFEFPASAQVGMKIMLTCSALEGQQPVSFVWLKDNQILSSQASGQQQQQASSLAQLHQQQLADKLALSSSASEGQFSYATAGGRTSRPEYVILGQPTPVGADNVHEAAREGAEDQDAEKPQLLPVLSDPNIRIRQFDDYSILSIDRLELKHSGRYTCSAQNAAARTSHASQLKINAPPKLSLEPKDGDLVSGQSSVIDCLASGQPKPSVSWLKVRESSNKLWDYLPVYDNLKFTIFQNGSLLISNVTSREQGHYLCSAKNGFGPEATKLIKITVHEPAKFSTKYKTVEVRIDERVDMNCLATGESPLTIDWFDKDGNAIQKDDKRFIIDNDSADLLEGTGVGQANSRASRLILTRGLKSDSGHYTCRASNKFGHDKMITNLLIQDVPDKITDLKVTNTTSSTISFRWQLNFNGNAPITSYLIQYQSDDPLDDLLASQQQEQQPPENLQATSSPIELAIKLLQTKKTPASAKKSLLDDTLISDLSEIDDESSIDRTLVELTIEQQQTSSGQALVNNNFLTIKDLTPYCVYRLRIGAINKIGLGEFSDWIRVKTEEAPPSGSALKISALATGPNSVKIVWNPPDRRNWNGQLIGFNIAYRPLDSSFEFNKTIEWSPPTLKSIMLNSEASVVKQKQALKVAAPEPAAMGNSSSIGTKATKRKPTSNQQTTGTTNSTADNLNQASHLVKQHLRQLLALQQQELVAHLTNLQRSTTYLIYLQAINNRGAGPQSHAISIKTLDDVPPSAPILKVQSTTTSSITIAWSLMSNFVSSANQYSLFYRKQLDNQNTNLQAARSMMGAGNNKNSTSLSEAPKLNPHGDDLSDPLMVQMSSGQQEMGPFIERSINGQMLLMSNQMNNGHLGFDSSSHEYGKQNPFQHQQQQAQQHYQQFVYTLDQLECGRVYELYMTTRNSVGKSEPSPVVTTRTQGEPPRAPHNKNNLFATIGSNDVALNIAAWSTGGCPITHITVRYKQAPSPLAAASLASQTGPISTQTPPSSGANSNFSAAAAGNSLSLTTSWPITTSVPTSILASLNGQLIQAQHQSSTRSPNNGLNLRLNNEPAGQPIYLLKNLAPSTCYDLELIAYNEAGFTSAQYEFVTSNLNGTRGGYSRKESIYRLDQRGIVSSDELIEQQQASSNLDSSNNNNAHNNQLSPGWQLAPFGLVLICFVCLIISSTFCYYKLNEFWTNSESKEARRQQRHNRRRSSLDTSASGVSGLVKRPCVAQHQRQPMLSASPDPRSKSYMWQMANESQHLKHSLDQPQQADQSPVHYCIREPAGHLENSSAAFTQSVSMKDFNIIPNSLPLGAAATLNLKSYRNGALNSKALAQESMKAGTMIRGPRLLSNQVNEAYDDSGRAETQLTNSELGQQAQYHRCNFANEGFQQQQLQDVVVDSSWPSYSNQDCKLTNGVTTYAIPSYGTTLHLAVGSQQQHQQEHEQQLLANCDNLYKSVTDSTAGNGDSVNACIQNLINQQYSEQQQQYAIIVNQQRQQQSQPPNGFIYGLQNDQQQQQHMTLFNNHHPQQQQLSANNSSLQIAGGAQSIKDSSSGGSSSGIEVGTHVDCSASSIITTTTTSTSNNNNDDVNNANGNYNSSCYQSAHPTDGFSERSLADNYNQQINNRAAHELQAQLQPQSQTTK